MLNEIGVPRKSADDALIELQKYLDQALHSESKDGFPDSALAKIGMLHAIHAYLKKNSRINDFDSENMEKGIPA